MYQAHGRLTRLYNVNITIPDHIVEQHRKRKVRNYERYIKQILSEIQWRYEDGAFSGNANIMW